MSGKRSRLGDLTARLRIEGVQGTVARLRTHWAERSRSRSFVRAASDWHPAEPISILHVLPTFPTTPFGGVESQLRARLEIAERPWALLRRTSAESWRLEIAETGRNVALELRARRSDTFDLAAADVETMISKAVERLQARILHCETPLGLPLGSLGSLAQSHDSVILSIHDFSLFCVRPNLYSPTLGRFCDYSTVPTTCDPCLQHTWKRHSAGELVRRRELAVSALSSCARVVFPSEFLQERHREIFGDRALERSLVIAPFSSTRVPKPRPPGPVRRVAFLGGGYAHKGAAQLTEVIAAARGLAVIFSIYGGDPLDSLAALRNLPNVRIRGTFRPGRLPDVLRRDAIDLALLMPAVPESYSLALDECLLAGVPVLTTDGGAVEDRLARWGGGWVVPGRSGSGAIVSRLRELSRPDVTVTVNEAVREHVLEARKKARSATSALYRELVDARTPG